MTSPRFSIVICTRNRRDVLDRCLGSLAQQWDSVPVRDWEVVVVDNGSQDGTASLVTEHARTFPAELRHVEEPTAGVSVARNRGLREARGDFVIFTDDDCTFEARWTKAWAEALDLGGIDAAAGRILAVFPPGIAEWFRDGILREGSGPTAHYDAGDQPLYPGSTKKYEMPYTANAAVEREAALAVGGFRVDLGYRGQKQRTRMACEDTEFFRRLRDSGARIAYFPGPAVHHHLTTEQASMDYYRRWHRGFGRASVLMDPRAKPLRRALRNFEYIFNLVFYSIRLLLPGAHRDFRAHRKQSQALGRLEQAFRS